MKTKTKFGSGAYALSACLPYPQHPVPPHQGWEATTGSMILSSIGIELPMGLVGAGSRPVRGQLGPVFRPAVFAAARTMHETKPTPHGHLVMLSTGWEEQVQQRVQRQTELGLKP